MLTHMTHALMGASSHQLMHQHIIPIISWQTYSSMTLLRPSVNLWGLDVGLKFLKDNNTQSCLVSQTFLNVYQTIFKSLNICCKREPLHSWYTVAVDTLYSFFFGSSVSEEPLQCGETSNYTVTLDWALETLQKSFSKKAMKAIQIFKHLLQEGASPSQIYSCCRHFLTAYP